MMIYVVDPMPIPKITMGSPSPNRRSIFGLPHDQTWKIHQKWQPKGAVSPRSRRLSQSVCSADQPKCLGESMRFQTLNPSFRPNIVYTYHIYVLYIINMNIYVYIIGVLVVYTPTYLSRRDL